MAGALRLDIGFLGGQVLSLRLSEDALKGLRSALNGGSGWHDVEAEDGQVALDLGKVAYIRLDSGEHRVGFITEN
ncbi:MAG: hypothetical protein AABM29_11375 [Actinomycetota bacterium]